MLTETLELIDSERKSIDDPELNAIYSLSVKEKRQKIRELEKRKKDLEEISKQINAEELNVRKIDWDLLDQLKQDKRLRVKGILKNLLEQIGEATDKDLLKLYEREVIYLGLKTARRKGGSIKGLGPVTFKFIEKYLKSREYIT